MNELISEQKCIHGLQKEHCSVCTPLPTKEKKVIEEVKEFETVHSLKFCVKKEFDFISCLAAEPIKMEIPEMGIVYEEPPIKEWLIRNTLFRRYSCLDYPGCSRCCDTHFWKLFLEQPSISSKALDVIINGQKRTYYCDNDNILGKCRYLDGNCTIYGKEPLYCTIPLINLYRKPSGRTIIEKCMFKKNRIGCPVKFGYYREFADFEADTISRFYRLKQYYDQLGLKTHIDEILEFLNKEGRKVITRRLFNVTRG